MPGSEIDFSDIPDSNPDSHGGFYYIQSLKTPKTDIHTKIDNDTLEWLKKPGKGYQTRLNNVLALGKNEQLPHCADVNGAFVFI